MTSKSALLSARTSCLHHTMHLWSVDTQMAGASVVMTLTSASAALVRPERTWTSLSPPPTLTKVRCGKRPAAREPFQRAATAS